MGYYGSYAITSPPQTLGRRQYRLSYWFIYLYPLDQQTIAIALRAPSAVYSDISETVWWMLLKFYGEMPCAFNSNAWERIFGLNRSKGIFLHFSKSLIFGFKWLLGLLGHYSIKKKICVGLFTLKSFVVIVILHSQVVPDYKYAYIFEAIYLRHKVTIYDLYELSFGIMFLCNLERSNQGQT